MHITEEGFDPSLLTLGPGDSFTYTFNSPGDFAFSAFPHVTAGDYELCWLDDGFVDACGPSLVTVPDGGLYARLYETQFRDKVQPA